MQDDKFSLGEIRKDLDRRIKTISDLKNRLQNLWEEISELIGEIDELEGKTPSRKRRGRKRNLALADAIGGGQEQPPEQESEQPPADETPGESPADALPEKLFSDEIPAALPQKPKRKPAPPKREGPSIVDVAEAILRETGTTFSPAELARMVEAKGVLSGNTQQVLLLAAGRKTRLVKTPEGQIALPGAPAAPAEQPAPPQPDVQA